MSENIQKYNKVKMHYESYIDENKQIRIKLHNNMLILGIIHDDENISDKRTKINRQVKNNINNQTEMKMTKEYIPILLIKK